MAIQHQARAKLKEKHIKWGQVYTEKTQFLKDKFEEIVGPGSYFRFEGDCPGTGERYYCIIGPARVHHPRAKFFAGVRKLPATYSAGGIYFDSLDRAATYARETWGVPTPNELRPYTSGHLHGIAKRDVEWRRIHEAEEERAEESEKENK